MALHFATGKSSQEFAIQLISRALGESAANLELGAAADWRANYRRVFASLCELEHDSAAAKPNAAKIQDALLEQLHALVVDDSVPEVVHSVIVRGTGAPAELSTIGAPTADALVANHLAEPGIRGPLGAFDALGDAQLNPDATMIAIGANAELSLAPEWLSLGGRVFAIARHNPAKWTRLLASASASGGELVVPVLASRATGLTVRELQELPHERLAELAGVDLEADLAAIAGWLGDLVAIDSRTKYAAIATVYAGGSRQILAAAAQDLLFARLMDALPSARLTLGWLGTPLDSIVASAELLDARAAGYANRGVARRIRDFCLRLVLRGPKPPVRSQIIDFSAIRQGSSYLLAKRVERWRAASAKARGYQTWLQVTPPAVTHSTVGYKVVRAAFRGATHFGITSFEPWMLRDLLTASLLGALSTGQNVDDSAAIHGGIWRSPYAPDSIWVPATILGWRALI